MAVLLGGGSRDHVDGVGDACLLGKQGAKKCPRLLAELGNDEAVRLAGICREHTRPTPVGKYRHPASLEEGL